MIIYAPKAVDDALRNPVLEHNPQTGEMEQVFPCKCGETHRGPYAIYDFGHHNCEHKGYPPSDLGDGDRMCVECGAML